MTVLAEAGNDSLESTLESIARTIMVVVPSPLRQVLADTASPSEVLKKTAISSWGGGRG
jgi:hypothetical protein